MNPTQGAQGGPGWQEYLGSQVEMSSVKGQQQAFVLQQEAFPPGLPVAAKPPKKIPALQIEEPLPSKGLFQDRSPAAHGPHFLCIS